ncbi:transcriptional regulator of the forkhead/HNF3 family [Scheffersomyces coipomensis]|uniref:transcriptional regulator of the forkhead/HNF3 family n=1 Tax=Scheffersomyces coipomensis TaxID=1788519 RepID=UPI00315CE17E
MSSLDDEFTSSTKDSKEPLNINSSRLIDDDNNVDVGDVPNIHELNLDAEFDNILNNHHNNDSTSTSFENHNHNNNNNHTASSSTSNNNIRSSSISNTIDHNNNDLTSTDLDLNNLHDLDLPLHNTPLSKVVNEIEQDDVNNRTVSNSPPSHHDDNVDQHQSLTKHLKSNLSPSQQEIRRNSLLVPITSEAPLDKASSKQQTPTNNNNNNSSHVDDDDEESSKISAYARLDFENFTFFVQTLQIILGRKSSDDLLQSSHHAVDVHLSSKKAISRRHAKIFYNFGTQQFEISILGRNGAFVDDLFVEKGITVPLSDGTKIQIGDIPFQFILPSIEPNDDEESSNINSQKQFNPTDAINLRSNLLNSSKSPTPKVKQSPKKDKKDKAKLDDKIPEIVVEDITKPSSSSSSSQKKSKHSDSMSSNEIANSRRNSILKIRRLSNARRKSLASSANDEINDILKELGVSSIDAINEENSEVLDNQLQSLLDDAGVDDMELNDQLMKLSQYSESAIEEEEDEIDKLVKQHNLTQGVNLDDDDDDDTSNNDNNNSQNDMDLSMLDQEIATLAPLIDAHNEGFIDEDSKLDDKKKKSLSNQKKSITDSNDKTQQTIRTTPLMGKPATIPRMGKLASIQPPASRLFTRGINGLPGTESSLVVSPAGTSNLIGTGTPTPLKGSATINNNNNNNNTTTSPLSASVPPQPPLPPPPKLEVPVLEITSEPTTIRSRPPLRAITVKEFEPNLTNFMVPKTLDEPSKYPKPKRKKDISKRVSKKVYSLDEIPENYRSKPSLSYQSLITLVLRSPNSTSGLSLNEIYDAIKELYPYYTYCPDGWQFSIAHSVKLNKTFKRTIKKADEWIYTMDELYIGEREKAKKKQQEIASARAKEAALKAEELKQKQRIEAQQAAAAAAAAATSTPSSTAPLVGRSYNTSPYGLPLNAGIRPGAPNSYLPQGAYKPPIPVGGGVGTNGQKPKTIAELASEIRRDGNINSKAPIYFKPQSNLPVTNSSNTSSNNNTIKAQLAANRSPPNSQSPAPQSSNSSSPIGSMNQDMKKSLAYLQKELFTLYKARNLSYNTATTTEIITKALATTIAQVNVIGAKAGCGDNALSFLVEKAPQQVSKILDIALTKSIKEKQGIISSRPTSRGATPGPSAPPTPVKQEVKAPFSQASPVVPTKPTIQTPPVPLAAPTPSSVAKPVAIVKPAPTIPVVTPKVESIPKASVVSPPAQIVKPIITATTPSQPFPKPTPPTITPPTISRPLGLSKPPSYKADSLGRPPNFSSPPSLSKPGGFAKPGVGGSGLSRPPTFLSNKPGLREANQSTTGVKRDLDENDKNNNENAKKIIKTE